ncbi:predicted protein [Botrytis cinerea T4]|uniref:Uncharacterized protein n=1 Tax=Botryotinia fuckeliana (strain T4) TaxID=999810 RepID=G2Y4T3_BOTF4|nr:predicted protein [Botrytis cinerea T4]
MEEEEVVTRLLHAIQPNISRTYNHRRVIWQGRDIFPSLIGIVLQLLKFRALLISVNDMRTQYLQIFTTMVRHFV